MTLDDSHEKHLLSRHAQEKWNRICSECRRRSIAVSMCTPFTADDHLQGIMLQENAYNTSEVVSGDARTMWRCSDLTPLAHPRAAGELPRARRPAQLSRLTLQNHDASN
ncbi:uncharacterized protein [Physcomitrium patens]|uniref:Uncharacterized protein n=1 Tax=Physcomitrium patens TaxID=3218 RepID=A9TDY5_PHYPA|nr:hypothetical protein PHYPA_019133 [Physcomitrium patens]